MEISFVLGNSLYGQIYDWSAKDSIHLTKSVCFTLKEHQDSRMYISFF